MKQKAICLGIVGLLFLVLRAAATVYYVNVNNAAPVSPFTTWATAATNIQDAIDAAVNGDEVLVTNGLYETGGRVMAGNLTNRVALDKALTVESVNGPWVTTIFGSGTANGTAGVRCAWLTNGAALTGFTLQGGATMNTGDLPTLESGGGAWCASSNAVVSNCLIVSNTAYYYGAGVYQGTLHNSLVNSNYSAFLAGAVYNAILGNCTIVSNRGWGVVSPLAMTNCIVYYNANGNCDFPGSAVAHCCITPSLAGSGNFTNAPQLFFDGVHLSNNSPCVGAGAATATGTDIFGQTWSNPPSIGCAEWQPAPLAAALQFQFTGSPAGFTVSAILAGQSPFYGSWLKNGVALQDNGHFSGTQTTSLAVNWVNLADAGGYQLIVSNSFGVATSAVTQLVIHCVDVNGANPVAPYLTWATAATNIQDAISAAVAGDVVLVTNGIYAVGGKSVDGVLTNRVSVDKGILVQSVNGSGSTVIQGTWNPGTGIGASAVRCVWLTNNAYLAGFTLRGGATRSAAGSLLSGGGVCGAPLNTVASAVVSDCLIVSNAAATSGGGAYEVLLMNCTLATNFAIGGINTGSGGGAERSSLTNCLLVGNLANDNGGGADGCNLWNCALIGNSAYLSGGAANGGTLVNCTVTGASVYGAALTNCIVSGNYASCTLAYCCADPLPAGPGNVDVNPQFLGDNIHLAASSPCIGKGTSSVVVGTDIDGQAWNNPPSIGCDEWQPVPLIAVQPACQANLPAYGLTFNVLLAGQPPFSCLWTQNGSPVQDDGHHSNSSTPGLVINHFGPEDSGVYQVVVSNAFGVVTSEVAQVVIHAVNVAGVNPVAPFSSWATAATNIQDAIEAAAPGDIVVVTNGVYMTGGTALPGGMTNRVTLDRAVLVTSANGYQATAIQGAWDPVSTNGPGAVRCAALVDGAELYGFSLINGATFSTGDPSAGGPLESGGGVWCSSPNATVSNCELSNNVAVYGGGIVSGTLDNSFVIGNLATYGGGGYSATLNNCTVVNNYARKSNYGAGLALGYARNSIVLNNYDLTFFSTDNYGVAQVPTFSDCCTAPVPSPNLNNLNVNPRFLDWFHLATTSPCLGLGNPAYATGTDLDGEPWNNPPAIGCDEVVLSNLVGPLAVNLQAASTNLLINRYGNFYASFTGRAAWTDIQFGDGVTATNFGTDGVHAWTNAGSYPVTFTAFNNDNPNGVSATLMVNIEPLLPPQPGLVGIGPGGFQFQFAAQTNAIYTIQYSTNLAQATAWQTLQTIFLNQSSAVQITDPAATNGTRFYRILAQ